MLKYIYIILLLFISIKVNANEININSKSHILIDYSTNTVLSKKNEHQKLQVASLTKIMTSYIVFDFIKKNNIDLETIIPISTNAVSTARRTNSARSFFEERHKITLHEALMGLTVHSGNDAAIALSEFISGTEEEFVALMNEYAIKLGMENTLFSNSSGLPTISDQYSTSYDIAILSRKLIKNFKILYDKYYNIEDYTHNEIFQRNRNRLLFIDNRFDGIKTGWTNQSGYCYATSIYENGRRLIIVTLNANSPEERFQDAIILSQYAYENYSNIQLTKKGKTIKGIENIPLYKSNNLFVELYNSEDFYITINNDLIDTINIEIKIPEYVVAPILKDQKIGSIYFKSKDEIIGESYLLSKNNYPIGSIKNYLLDTFYLNFKK